MLLQQLLTVLLILLPWLLIDNQYRQNYQNRIEHKQNVAKGRITSQSPSPPAIPQQLPEVGTSPDPEPHPRSIQIVGLAVILMSVLGLAVLVWKKWGVNEDSRPPTPPPHRSPDGSNDNPPTPPPRSSSLYPRLPPL